MRLNWHYLTCIIGILALLVFFLGLFYAVEYNDSLNKQRMQACVSQPNHEWVQNDFSNHDYECRVTP